MKSKKLIRTDKYDSGQQPCSCAAASAEETKIQDPLEEYVFISAADLIISLHSRLHQSASNLATLDLVQLLKCTSAQHPLLGAFAFVVST